MSDASRRVQFIRQNWMLLGVLAAALGVAGWFAFQFVATFLFLHDPRNHDGDLKAWMNPHFVMVMYDLPRPLVHEILKRPLDETGGVRLGHVAQDLGLTMEELTARVRAAAETYREQAE